MNILHLSFKANDGSSFEANVKLPIRMFSLKIIEHGEKKIQVIKEIRRYLGLGLREAKQFSECLPTVVRESEIKGFRDDQSRITLKDFGKALIEAGATVVEADTLTESHRFAHVIQQFFNGFNKL